MKGLLLVAHGSRRKESNEEIIKLTAQIEQIADNEFDIVSGAFLQYASPDISEQIESYVKKGVTEIKIFPYFIAAGNHVVVDIPEIIGDFRKKYPQIRIELTKHLGGFMEIAEFIIDKVK